MRNQVNDRPTLRNQAVKFVTVNLKQKEMPYLLKTVVIFYGNKQEKKKQVTKVIPVHYVKKNVTTCAVFYLAPSHEQANTTAK